MEYLSCIRPSITFRRFSQFLFGASPRSGKWRRNLPFESQREGLSDECVQSKRPSPRKTTNHTVVNPNPSYQRNLVPSASPLRQQPFTGRRSQVLPQQQNKTFVLVRDCSCVWHQIRWVCHNWLHQSHRDNFFWEILDFAWVVVVVVVAAVDSFDLPGLLIISLSSNQQASQSGHERYKDLTVGLELQMSVL